MPREPRAIVVVLDGVGVGALSDAHEYGDEGSDTLGNIARSVDGLSLPVLGALGIGNVIDIVGVPPRHDARASWGKCAEESPGKDTTTGHWEMMGLRLEHPFPTYPDGFPPDVMEAFERECAVGWLGNKPASGTVIIQELGDEHVRTGRPIVYTSADSVFQVAAHEEVIPPSRLYSLCERVRERVCRGRHSVARVIARPFVGPDACGSYVRTHRRRDFAVRPFGLTALDLLSQHGVRTYGIGKIGEIFAWQGVHESVHSEDNMHGFDNLIKHVEGAAPGFIFANLVDFDMAWGHRNDVRGFALGLEQVDARFGELLDVMLPGDMLVITADHGCDPTTDSTDHSREYVPLLATIKGVEAGVDLGVRSSFSDIGRTVLDFYGYTDRGLRGESFLGSLYSPAMVGRR